MLEIADRLKYLPWEGSPLVPFTVVRDAEKQMCNVSWTGKDNCIMFVIIHYC